MVCGISCRDFLIAFGIFTVLTILGISGIWYAGKALHSGGDPDNFTPLASAKEAPGGKHLMTVDASSFDHWVLFSFSTGRAHSSRDLDSIGWDFGFRRHRMVTAGGSTQSRGDAAVLDLGAGEIRGAPQPGHPVLLSDIRTRDSLETENPALSRWYHYDWITHRLKSLGHVYLVRTHDGRFARLKILGYYCDKRPGCISFEYLYPAK
ncbi:MAG: HmuY family protein [Armatimonadetes bacterium]|nr:HmuY family protein [Armatimonadota bacterium]